MLGIHPSSGGGMVRIVRRERHVPGYNVLLWGDMTVRNMYSLSLELAWLTSHWPVSPHDTSGSDWPQQTPTVSDTVTRLPRVWTNSNGCIRR